jgi:hypothetical protein
MKRLKKLTVWISGTIAVLILLAGALVLLGPWIINSDAAKREIVNHLSRKAGVQVQIEQTDFSFFPRPRVVIYRGGLSIAGRVSADIQSVTVYPRIWPLLVGRIELVSLSAQSPRVTIELPALETRGRTPTLPWTDEEFHHNLVALLAPVVSEKNPFSLQVQNGNVALVSGGKTILEVDHIQLLLEPSSKALVVELTGQSDFCKNMSLKARLDAVARKAEGRIDLKGLRPALLPTGLVPEGPIRPGNDETGLELVFEADLNQGITVDIQGSAPMFTLMRGDETTAFRGARFKGRVHQRPGGLIVSLSGLHLDQPRLDLSGEMAINSEAPRMRMKLAVREVDVPSVREAALILGRTIPRVRQVFDVVRGGDVPLMTVTSQADAAADLGKPDHLALSGRIANGRIFIPQTRMDLTEVSGNVSISTGLLTGTSLQARLGKASGRDGSLRIGLIGGNRPFHLDMAIRADLTEALPFVQRLITHPSFKGELGQIDQIEGTAAARLILGDSTGSIKVRFDVSQFDLIARYRPIPYLIRARGGGLSYASTSIKAHQIGVSIGQSTFAGLSGRLDWDREPFLDMGAGGCAIYLDEAYSWLASLNQKENRLRTLSHLKGSILLNSLAVKGPLLTPMSWQFKTDGRIRDLVLVSSRLPGPLTLGEGSFNADAETIGFKGTGLNILDARLDLSGEAADWLQGINSVDAAIDGEMGPEAVRTASEAVRLPEDILLKAPVAISNGRLAWNRAAAETSFAGNLSVSDGPRISLNGTWTPVLFRVDNLLISDETSRAALRFSLGQDAVGIGFAGNLTQTCLASLLRDNQSLTGWINGDIQGRIIPGNPPASTIEGHLEGGNIRLRQLDLPATLDTFSLQAGQQKLKFRSDILALDDRRIGVEVDLDRSETGILLRLDLAADSIDLEETKTAFEKVGRKFTGGRDPTQWSAPIVGTAHIKLNRLTYGKFEWKPFACNISSEGDAMRIAVKEASLCGVSAPGFVEISPKNIAIHVKPAAEGRELSQTLDCLTGESVKISGTFDFKGDIRGEGTGEGLLRSLDGPIHFVSKNGRIDRFGILMKIFSLLNITEIFRGQLPDLSNQGFAYNSITVDGHLKGGTLALTNVLLNAPSMNIACTGHVDLLTEKLDLAVFAAPFKTADRMLRVLPLIGYILDDTLVSIAIKVTGDLKEPDVDYLPAFMLGSGLLGIMERTLMAPVKVLTPMMPK